MSEGREPTAETVSRAIREIGHGRPVLLLDDERTPEFGNLVVAGELASADAINFMARHGRGIVSLALPHERCEELGLRPIGGGSEVRSGGVPMVSIEARVGVTTGISAGDRSLTTRMAVDPALGAEGFVQPGHVLPLRASPGGLDTHTGRVEAAIYLAEAANLRSGAVLCEMIGHDGSLATPAECRRFASEYGLGVVSLAAVKEHSGARGSRDPSPSAVSTRGMRDAMGHFATGVSVITTAGEGGWPVGTTANAITSVSLRPPLLLCCLSDQSETLAAIRESGRFVVNLLSSEQRHHSDRFAIKGTAARSEEVEFSYNHLGLPFLPGSLATISCEVDAIYPAGDHSIVLGRVRSLAAEPAEAEPLLFFRGEYSRLESPGLSR